MKVVVSQELCGGHGECVAIAPDVFAFVGDDDVVSVVLWEPAGDLCAAVADAVTCFPTQAISIAD
jgi:ferredoxin